MTNGVQLYQFPTDDETVAEINSTMNVSTKQIHEYKLELNKVVNATTKWSHECKY